MGKKHIERRREPRYPLNIQVEIGVESPGPRLVGVSRNACSGGLLIATQGRFEEGEPVRVAFRVRRDGRMREIEGKVLRCDTDPAAELYPRLVAVRLARPSLELLAAEPGCPRVA